jgi:hypothetical protein
MAIVTAAELEEEEGFGALGDARNVVCSGGRPDC